MFSNDFGRRPQRVEVDVTAAVVERWDRRRFEIDLERSVGRHSAREHHAVAIGL